MKYIDVNSVVKAYLGFQDCMTNKSWGYLALLKGCKGRVHPSIAYEVELDKVSNFLENIFNLNQTKKQYNGGRSLYVVFSNKWDCYFKEQGRYFPNIYDVAIWAYRRRAFADNVTEDDVVRIFSEEFNISMDVISNGFDMQQKEVIFSNSLYLSYNFKYCIFSVYVIKFLKSN